MFNFLLENNLVSPNQSGFKPGDSCINQLLSITQEIFQSFYEGFEVRSVFLDISKAFDKVRHKGLISNDLKKVSNWAFQWKMSFYLDPRNQAQEVAFS